MIAEIGAFAAVLALMLSLAQGVIGLAASRRDSRAEAAAAIAQASRSFA
jgi:cytochrome c biogenesis factor